MNRLLIIAVSLTTAFCVLAMTDLSDADYGDPG